MMFVADEGLNYETTFSWYCAVRPVGRMSEKEAVMGWRAYLERVKEIFSRLGVQYLIGTRNEMALCRLRNLRELRLFCSDLLTLSQRAKEDGSGYWPSVVAAVPQKDLQFAEEVVGKFNVDWSKLSPDVPHLHFRDAFMIREWFTIHEARYGGEESLNSWCNIGLDSENDLSTKAPAEIVLPRALMIGDRELECFYCGLHNHAPADCPTKRLDTLNPGLWKMMARLDVKELSDGLAKLDKLLLESGTQAVIQEALGGKAKDLPRQLLRAVFELSASTQLRTLQLVWKAKGKEWPEGLKQVVEDDGLFAQDALAAILEKHYEESAEELKRIRLKYPRSYIPSSLQGFHSLEAGDLNQALFYWQEAERLSITPLQQGYFIFLQARLQEISGELKEATGLYRRAYTTSPGWTEPLYRSAVCMVKMGFTGQGVDMLNDILKDSPGYFNHMLIDPELDRGRTHVLQSMWELWGALEAEVQQFRDEVDALQSEIVHRFEEDHEFFEPAQKQLARLKSLSELNNFVAFHGLIHGIALFRDKLGKQVERDVKRMQKDTEHLIERLKDVQSEASWFPFPKLLREFNHDFNYCVEKMNWIMHQHIKSADNFRQARRYLLEVEDRLKALRSRLVTLRIIRDSTLFALMLGRAFIWMEVIGLGLALVGIPTLIYFTRGVENVWLLDIIREKQWEFQKGLILILSVTALTLAAIKSAFSFEKRKRELFERTP
jgi:tetratricopeptide (TPR) repeat protein